MQSEWWLSEPGEAGMVVPLVACYDWTLRGGGECWTGDAEAVQRNCDVHTQTGWSTDTQDTPPRHLLIRGSLGGAQWTRGHVGVGCQP